MAKRANTGGYPGTIKTTVINAICIYIESVDLPNDSWLSAYIYVRPGDTLIKQIISQNMLNICESCYIRPILFTANIKNDMQAIPMSYNNKQTDFFISVNL